MHCPAEGPQASGRHPRTGPLVPTRLHRARGAPCSGPGGTVCPARSPLDSRRRGHLACLCGSAVPAVRDAAARRGRATRPDHGLPRLCRAYLHTAFAAAGATPAGTRGTSRALWSPARGPTARHRCAVAGFLRGPSAGGTALVHIDRPRSAKPTPERGHLARMSGAALCVPIWQISTSSAWALIAPSACSKRRQRVHNVRAAKH